LHQGKVKQIVGSTLREGCDPVTNFEPARAAAGCANLYRRDGLTGGHVMLLGPGNETAAREALAAYPDGLQVGGGVNPQNAQVWLDAGASHVIVTSYVFCDGQVDWDNLAPPERSGSARTAGSGLELPQTPEGLFRRDGSVAEVHLGENRRRNVVAILGVCRRISGPCGGCRGEAAGSGPGPGGATAQQAPIPVTYAGGVSSLDDLREVHTVSRGRLNVTIGSALEHLWRTDRVPLGGELLPGFESGSERMSDWRKLALWGVLRGGLMPRLLVLRADSDTSVSLLLDDSFYYFKVAQNVVDGYGSTFDRIHPTNGYHPLWLGVLLPVASLVRDPWVFVRVVVSLSILFNTLTACLIWKVLDRNVRLGYGAVLGAALFFFNPRVAQSSVNGMETALSTFCVMAGVALTLLRSRAPSEARGHRVLLGLALGLMFLARTDNAFYILALVAVALVEEKPGRRFGTFCWLGLVSGLLVAPWLAWNVWQFGGVMQVSGKAIPVTTHMQFMESGHSHTDLWIQSARILAQYWTSGIYGIPLGMPRWLVLGAGAFSALALSVRWYDTNLPGGRMLRRSVMILLALGAGAFLMLGTHTFFRWHPRDYYCDSAILLLVLGFSFALAFFDPGRVAESLVRCCYGTVPLDHGVLRCVLVVLMLAGLAWGGMTTWRALNQGRNAHQAELYEAACWLRDNLPENEVAAGFNVGIVGFFSGRRVVNLDGVINNAAYEALVQRDLFGLMRQAGVRYYVDYDPFMLDRYRFFWGEAHEGVQMPPVAPIRRPDVPFWCGRPVRVLRLDWR
jgi:phosphoribosylformimino-5-aminoimidazole carboxamide ribotide isomerase